MRRWLVGGLVVSLAARGVAGVGDPQTRTEHPWFPGELACSTFERLYQTQTAIYTRVTGRIVDNDEDRALAAWYWRNRNYYHCELVGEDIGSSKGDRLNREYWAGLFGYGFGLCFDTHHQFGGEIWNLLGPNRCRTMGADGHTTFEVYLKGGPYGAGQWALLDHDISTVVFQPDGSRLAGLMEVSKDMSLVTRGDRARGWLPGGLHPSDPNVYRQVKWAGYTTGYAAVPPMVSLRAGETLRRYADPGQEDGKTFCYWGVSRNAGKPGPMRDLTWVSQPEKMYQTKKSCTGKLARYGNAVYTYKPDFRGGAYQEGVVAESDSQVTFEWYSPYVIGALPAAEAAGDPKGVLKPGATGGLVIRGSMKCPVAVSVDQGSNWVSVAEAKDGLDLTDAVKGSHQYLLRFGAGARALAESGLTIVTVCQCSSCVVPHVQPGANRIAYEATGRAYVSAGPNRDQAAAHVVAGAMGTPAVTLQLAVPRGAAPTAVYAAAHVAAGTPPRDCPYNIDCSTDGGATWLPVLKDYRIQHPGPEPNDWWSQALMMGRAALAGAPARPVQVRFANGGGRTFMRVEAHLVYDVPNSSPLQVTYAWREAGGVRTASHTYPPRTSADSSWSFEAGPGAETVYVEYRAP